MVRIRYISKIDQYCVLFEDGSKERCPRKTMEDLFPNRDWDVVKEKTDQWFYV